MVVHAATANGLCCCCWSFGGTKGINRLVPISVVEEPRCVVVVVVAAAVVVVALLDSFPLGRLICLCVVDASSPTDGTSFSRVTLTLWKQQQQARFYLVYWLCVHSVNGDEKRTPTSQKYMVLNGSGANVLPSLGQLLLVVVVVCGSSPKQL